MHYAEGGGIFRRFKNIVDPVAFWALSKNIDINLQPQQNTGGHESFADYLHF